MTKSAIWIQRKSPADHSVVILDGKVTYDNDIGYKNKFNHFSNLIKKYKVRKLSDGCSVGGGLIGFIASGYYEELDNRGRHVPYTFYATGRDIDQILSKLREYSLMQEFSIQENNITSFKKELKSILKKRIFTGLIILAILILITILII